MLNIDKLTYSIGQISELTEIAQSTLRYWETVIVALDPFKTDGGSRRYSKDDVETVLTIKDLLYNQGFTIKGANLFLKKQVDGSEQQQQNVQVGDENFSKSLKIDNMPGNVVDLKPIVDELKKIKNILGK